MNRCSFDHELIKHEGYRILCLTDHNNGSMSLTNGIEDVVDDMRKIYIPFPDFIVYLDTDGVWDGWDDLAQKFIFLGADCKEAAAIAICERHESFR